MSRPNYRFRNLITNKNLLGYVNPFATTSKPRIPDGSVTHSLPIKHRVIDTIKPYVLGSTEPQDPLNPTTIHAFLFPGVTGGFVWCTEKELNEYNSLPPPPSVVPVEAQYQHLKDSPGNLLEYTFDTGDYQGSFNAELVYDKAGEDSEIPTPNSSWEVNYVGTGGGNPDEGISNFTGIAKFRNVSQGIKFSLLNTDEQNDGWWEAVRIPYLPNMEHWDCSWSQGNIKSGSVKDPDGNNVSAPIQPPDGTKTYTAQVDVNGVRLRPSLKMFDEFLNKNIAENQTYQQGLLKDIKYKWFGLGNITPNHEFADQEKNWVGTFTGKPKRTYTNWFGPSTQFPDYLDAGNVGLTPGEPESKRIFRSFYDGSNDIVYLRFHPGNSGSQILTELVTNQEMVYGADVGVSKYQYTAPRNNPRQVQQARAIRQQQTETAAVTASPMDTLPDSAFLNIPMPTPTPAAPPLPPAGSDGF